MMHGLDRRDDRHVRPDHGGQRQDLAGMVHADLEDPETRVPRGIRARVSGTPQ